MIFRNARADAWSTASPQVGALEAARRPLRSRLSAASPDPVGSALMEAVGTVHEGANLGHVPCRLLVNVGSDEVATTVTL